MDGVAGRMSDITILVSPAEPYRIRQQFGDHGTISLVPERYGCDFAWRARNTWWGCQRKTVSDLLASVDDGRLIKEVGQMLSKVSMPTLIIEGRPTFTLEGRMAAHTWSKDRWTVKQWRGFMWTVASRGIHIAHTDTPTDTVEYVRDMAAWSNKATHTSVTARPKLVDSTWGTPGNRDWGTFLLQSFEGIGAGVAGDIYDHFGHVPLQWSVTRDELLQVKGLGPKRVDRMIESLRRNGDGNCATSGTDGGRG